jgi:rhamnosyltransferase
MSSLVNNSKIMSNIPKIAVLLAAHNCMNWVNTEIKSILSQEGVELTLFISLDLSVDGSEKWAYELSELNSNVVFLPYGQYFGGAAPNFFRLLRDVDFLGYDAVAFADQDDVWFPNKLYRALKFLQAKKCDIYSSSVIAFWPKIKHMFLDKSQPQKKFDHFFEAAGPGSTYVFNIAAATMLQNFVIRMHESLNHVYLHDWLAYAFCRERGFVWFIDSSPLILYRQHAFNQVGANVGISGFKKRVDMVKKKWYRKQVELIAGLVAPEKVGFLKDRSFLMRNFMQLRRRSRDRWILLFLIIFRFY